jgi:hypothetical protein
MVVIGDRGNDWTKTKVTFLDKSEEIDLLKLRQ